MNWARLFASPGGRRPERVDAAEAAKAGTAERADLSQPTAIHRQIQSAIDAQIDALGSVALVTGPGCRDRSAIAVGQLLTSLRADRKLLREHWPSQSPTTSRSTTEPAASTGCGEPQPCPDTLALARKYHVRLR
ncbi:MAG: hypothetical protein L0H96_25290 [Humibacillus sp.]|nr:hypothetical protein [Humibacillus sp.]MDN5780197.1 hypothetical protein [Humibacillus sp.]